MSCLAFARIELSAALARGVRQCVLIGSRPHLEDLFLKSPEQGGTESPMEVFAVDQEQSLDLPATFVPTEFDSEELASALERSGFDKVKSTFFVWLGDAGYRTFDAALASLAFIASLPKGSGVVLNYVTERSSFGSLTHTALDALASQVRRGGTVMQTIQPEALALVLRALGFQNIVDMVPDEFSLSGERLVSAIV